MATATNVTPAKRTVPAASTSRRRASVLEMALVYLILIIAVFFALFPVWFLFTASIRPGQTLFSTNLASALLPTETT
ncbi:MAG: hypothetical protein JOZ51_05525, partial [Chloroflexi bacterium]|nr:hypothetical protein [Chloroflexota bacterium]